MIIAAEFGVGQVLWSLFWFYLFMMWVMLVFFIFADIIGNDEMDGMTKALWALAIIFLPYLGVLMYIVVNGRSMGARQNRYSRTL
ncbi:MAG: PLDc N-terminal domain-containing protein [Acidimicrobiales bacterium]